jgi:hypothetical protein
MGSEGDVRRCEEGLKMMLIFLVLGGPYKCAVTTNEGRTNTNVEGETP